MKTPSEVIRFETLSDSKALPAKYAMFFKDEEIRNSVQVVYYTGEDKFVVTVKGEYFTGETWKTPHAQSAYNFVKLYMISKKHRNRHIVDELKWVLTKEEAVKPWSQLRDSFLDRILKTKMEISTEALEDLGITKNMMVAKKFGI